MSWFPRQAGRSPVQLGELLQPRTLIDVLIWVVAGPLALYLRTPHNPDWQVVLTYSLLGIPVKFGLAYFNGLFRYAHGFLSLQGIWTTIRTVLLGELILLIIMLMLRLSGGSVTPLSVPLIEGALTLAALFGMRLYQRALLEPAPTRLSGISDQQRLVIIGAGEAGYLMARSMLSQPEQALRPVAFVDDNPARWGQLILGLPVVGGMSRIAQIARQWHADQLLIAVPSASGETIRHLHEQASATGLPVRTVPSLAELVARPPQLSQLRNVRLDDLLRRAPVQLDDRAIGEYLRGRTVLVTGAGGSIGSELARQVARYQPDHLILFGRGENSIFAIQQELLESFPELHQTAIIGDVRHAVHLRRVFTRHQPQVVFHAAAHKHVPLMEDSPAEAVYNNVIGTRIVTELCLEFGVARFVNISSDKAVNPSSVMGSSKRLAEMVIGVAAKQVRPGQAFMSVRFGNVLGSRGSVVPTFLRQIASGGPVTITDERMTRYFMTIPEASRLVLQAGALAHNGRVYVLKMGDPVRIVDLARDLIRLSGRQTEISFTGIRPGEKLYEELLTEAENVEQTDHADIFIAKLETPDAQWLDAELEKLEAYARDEDYPHIRRQIQRMIPESRLQEQR